MKTKNDKLFLIIGCYLANFSYLRIIYLSCVGNKTIILCHILR